MPGKLEIHFCKGCGSEWQSVWEAENCENSHLRSKDIEMARIEKPANDEFCYEPQGRWPTFIYVRCITKSIDGKVYQLVDTVRRSRRVVPGGVVRGPESKAESAEETNSVKGAHLENPDRLR